jgi:TPR repeat protein
MQKVKLVVVAIVLSVSMALCFASDCNLDYHDDLQALKQNDYEKALCILEPLARQGDVKAQDELATMYYFGLGVAPDNEVAVKWYETAAKAGYAPSQYHLGNVYRTGVGVGKPNLSQALFWYSQAAVQGHSAAYFEIGNMHANGLGVERDICTALKWYEMAASAGDSDGKQIIEKLRQDHLVDHCQ